MANGNGSTAKELRGIILDTVKNVDGKVDKLDAKIEKIGEKVEKYHKDVAEEMTDLKLDVNSMKVENKVKTAVFGLIGGLIPALGVLIYFLASR